MEDAPTMTRAELLARVTALIYVVGFMQDMAATEAEASQVGPVTGQAHSGTGRASSSAAGPRSGAIGDGPSEADQPVPSILFCLLLSSLSTQYVPCASAFEHTQKQTQVQVELQRSPLTPHLQMPPSAQKTDAS